MGTGKRSVRTAESLSPEAPTTEAGRRLLDQWNPGHVNPRLVQTVLAIEAEARAASQPLSQERPPVDTAGIDSDE
jgi:hypothetical protein